MPEWLWKLLLAAVIVQIPFELRYKLFGLSNLQWTFVAFALAGIPLLVQKRKVLVHDRLLQAAAVFVAIQWVIALLAPEFQANAIKAAIRFTAGFALLVIVRAARSGKLMTKTWAVIASLAAVYALAEYAGLGFPGLFRTGEFYIGQIRRLSGSFEYPNTAAAYFAMSLPIVWWSPFRLLLRSMSAFFLWAAVVLTFSKGALIAVLVLIVLAGLKQWKSAALLLGIGAAAYGALLPLNPYLIERIFGPAARNPLAAEYKTPWNDLQEQPGRMDSVPLTIRNTGISTWRSSGLWRDSIGGRWWNIDTERFSAVAPVVTPLPHSVGRGETVAVDAAFRTPETPGHYLLVFELFSKDFDWFSRTGVIPLLIRTEIRPDVARTTLVSDISTQYRRGRQPGVLTAKVSRESLWTAAWKIFKSHPLGIGPDNYRLEYGKYLSATRWDTRLLSNNLYLEILTGSGILGLAAFFLMLGVRAWHKDAASLGAGVFLLHGVVDVFLMTTPIYFAFWMFCGMEDQ
jgi:hypothetical protein